MDISLLSNKNEVLHTSQLLLALLFGVLMSTVIWYGHKCFSHYFLSACASSTCVRCHNAQTIQEKAVKRFHELEKVTSIDISVRIKMGITGAAQLQSKSQIQKPNVLHIPNLNTRGWLDPSEHYVEDTKILRRNFALILEEYEKVFTMNQPDWVVNKVPNGEWLMFYLMNQGEWVKKNCELCPKSVKIIKSLKNAMHGCVFANSGFSVLQPHAEIEPHFGPTNARIRCHLALKVTKNALLRVEKENRSWKTANCLLFDDSFLHSAKHAGNFFDGPRAVLIVDLWNPWLTLTERYIVQKCYNPVD